MKCVLCILALALWPSFVAASFLSEMTGITEQCCNAGSGYARAHDVRDCTASAPPPVPLRLAEMCRYAMDECCRNYFDKKVDCEIGVSKILDFNQTCDSTNTEPAKSCCKECIRGIDARASGGTCVGEAKGHSAEMLLLSDAFTKCCNDIPEDVSNKKHEHSFPSKVMPLIDNLTSVCEDYAPNELCAHHCIPVPGSYRCECKPGFKLMADGRNCMEITKNRCKPKNDCQHKCNDNGVEVKCSCRRGYRLQADGKSCKDIDECASQPPACLPGHACLNILGSYKCIPVKRKPELVCPSGFTKNLEHNACDDINECALMHPPCAAAVCENTVGAYRCGGARGDPELFSRAQPPPQHHEERCPPGFRTGGDDQCQDVDECETERDDCNRLSQFCINTKGSFYCQDKASRHCPPGFKINERTTKCEDIDECQEGHNLCPRHMLCGNVPGAYECRPPPSGKKCPEGTRMVAGSDVCEDIDECAEGTHVCDQHQSCLNTDGGHECRCRPGFQLDDTTGACIDINECATDQNDCFAATQRCDNTVGSYVCVRFISCGTGYTLQHSTNKCEDIDECALGKDNCHLAGPDYKCVNTPGFFRCVKEVKEVPKPKTFNDDDYYYYDTDEESKESTNSSASPASSTTEASTTLSTTTLSTTTTTTTIKPPTTVSTTESALPETTPYIPQLIITESTKVITEVKQYTPKNESSSDRNQVLLQPDNASNYPTNRIGNEEKTQITVTDDVVKYSEPSNEARRNLSATTPHIVMLEVANETATVNGEKKQDGSVFIDTNNLPKNQWTKVAEKPSHGTCQFGFEMDEYGACVDIDECETHKHTCSGLTEVCDNTMGSYQCKCRQGFIFDPITASCEPIIIDRAPVTASSTSTTFTTTTTTTELSTTSTTTEPSTTKRVYWGLPGYQFSSRPFVPRNPCDSGFHWDTTTGRCEDIDECRSGRPRCADAEVCVNLAGGYRCECPPRWSLDAANNRCVPDRARGRFPSGYGNLPEGGQLGGDNKRESKPQYTHRQNPVGAGYTCPPGYRIGGARTCEDIDECLEGIASCGPEKLCTNRRGGYLCSCPLGFQLVDDHQCRDIDECSLPGPPLCSHNADCVNTPGSFRCKCHHGFQSAPVNDKICIDVDECAAARPGGLCQQRCNNALGGYRCSCHRGYRLNEDNRTCADVDECATNDSKKICDGLCVNQLGSYRCACPPGYRMGLDGKSCIDINECDTGAAACSAAGDGASRHVCVNIPGSYSCYRIACQPGYSWSTVNKNRCMKTNRDCNGDYACVHQPSTYSFHTITFVSKLKFDANKTVDLFTLKAPNPTAKFELRFVKVDAPPTVKKATPNSFTLKASKRSARLSLVEALEGPQSVELDLVMEAYREHSFLGIAVAKIAIFVSEYEF